MLESIKQSQSWLVTPAILTGNCVGSLFYHRVIRVKVTKNGPELLSSYTLSSAFLMKKHGSYFSKNKVSVRDLDKMLFRNCPL